MASANVPISVTLAFNLTRVEYLANGDKVAVFTCTDPSGTAKKTKSYTIRADGTGIYDNENGTQLAANSTTLSGNLDTFKTNADSGMTTAAGAGKVVF